MDDAFDELDIPDNWLDFGSKRRNEETDFTADKKLKSDFSTQDSSYAQTSAHIGFVSITPQPNISYQNGLTNNMIEKTACMLDNNSVSGSFDSVKGDDPCLGVKVITGCSDAPSHTSFFDTYDDWSLNEPEFYDSPPNQFLSGENQSQPAFVNHALNLEKSASLASSSATIEDSSLNNPTLSTFCQEVVKEQDKNNDKLSGSANLQGCKVSSNSERVLLGANVENFVEHLSFTDDELRYISSEPGHVITVESDNQPTQSSSKQEPGFKPTPASQPNLIKISSLVRDAQIISGIVPGRDFNEIYNTLLDHRDDENRLDIATVLLLDKPATSSKTETLDIFEEVQVVLSAVPHADANFVYTLLESLPPSSKRVTDVIQHLNPALNHAQQFSSSIKSSNQKPTLKKKESSIDDPHLKNDPLFKDMRTIARIFPETDRNEIYALLEANHNKANRLQAVIEEIGKMGQEKSQEITIPDQDENIVLSTEDILEQDIDVMKNIFPDCDPNFLYEKLESMKSETNRTDLLASEMFEKKDYPKIKDIAEKSKTKEKEQEEFARLEKVRKLDLTVEEFCQKFPDPVKTFGDESTQKSALYQDHAYCALRNEFRMLKAGYLKVAFLKHNSHFYPTYQQICTEVLTIPLDQRHKFMNKFMKHPRSHKVPMPPKADEYFYHEYWFVLNEQKMKDEVKQKEEEKVRRIEEAKAKGELFECGCCYDDECLFEDLSSCPEGHLFCKTCVIRSTEAAFGEMKTKFPCLSGECEQNIPLSILQTVIPANLFSKIVQRMQEEEILQANIQDLVSCPFCPFATIMPNPDDKVFKCLNPECLKESCRLCQEPNHIPLRCNEVEKKAETNMRTFIENRISEAVMRKCHKCGKSFVKEIGCNKMTCICGATSCYACKKQNIGYDHFNNNKECADTDPNLIHKKDMEAAAVKAKQDYLEMHPEAASIELKTDIDDMIKGYVSSSKDIKNIPMIGPGGYLGREYGGDW